MLSARALASARYGLLPKHRSKPVPCTSCSTNTTQTTKHIDPQLLTFDNSQEAFRSKSNLQLARGLLVLRLLAVDTVVKHNHSLTKRARQILGKSLFTWLMRSTIYGHFVAGATQDEIKPVVTHMREFGVKSILDYSVERDVGEEAEDITIDEYIPKPDKAEIDKLKQQQEQQDVPVLTVDAQVRYKPYKELWDRRVGVTSARTYFYRDEPECDKNLEIFLKCVDAAALATEGTGFVAVKMTALGRPTFLIKLSEVIARSQTFYRALTGGGSWQNVLTAKLSKEEFLAKIKDLGVKTDKDSVKHWFDQMDYDEDGFVDLYEWGRIIDDTFEMCKLFQILSIQTGELVPLVTDFTDEDDGQFRNMMRRLVTLVEYAKGRGVRVMIDAEQTYFQPAINRLTLEMMRKYNKDEPVIFNTYQAYLKAARATLHIDMHLAERENFHFGCKLVRGAYMDQERKRASVIGYEDPINANYEATSAMYERMFLDVLDERDKREVGKVSVMCATHNEDSVRMAVAEMSQRDIAPDSRLVCFGQLYGMCDQVSFTLGQSGYSVYKYVPYGPVDEVLPYLSRRAAENSGIIKKAQKERKMLWNELKRRWLKGQIIYRPDAT